MRIVRPEDAPDPSHWHWAPLSPQEEKEALRLAKESFTAEDLQKFTEIVEEIPMEDVLAELYRRQKEYDKGKNK